MSALKSLAFVVEELWQELQTVRSENEHLNREKRQGAEALAESEQRYTELNARLNHADNVLRELIEIVDPSIWEEGHADTRKLIEKVRWLREHVEDPEEL